MLVCCAVVVVGCAKPEERAPGAETAAGTVTPAPVTPTTPSPTISLANVAGKWKMRAMDASGGNVVEVELTATADSSDWTIVGPNRPPIQERVIAVAGDSIVTEAGPYESFIRKGVQVRTRNVYRLQDGKLVSTMEARYATKGGDSVSQRESEGTRVR
jgi:hypothetical protein